MLDEIRSSLSLVFGGWGYRALAAGMTAALFIIYISVPVIAIPGNSYGRFLAMLPPLELAETAALSAVMGVVLTMQVYAWRNDSHSIPQAGAGLAGLISGSISALFSAATCASCMSALFSFIGFGGIVFFIQHRAEMMALTFVVLGASFYFTSRKIAGKCASCGVPYPKEPVHEGEKKESAE